MRFWATGTPGSSRCWSCSSRARRGSTSSLELGRFFFVETVEYDETAIAKHVRVEGMRGHLEALDRAFAETSTFDASSTESALRSVAESRGVKAAALIHATRVALTGQNGQPWTVRSCWRSWDGRAHAGPL